MGLRGGLPPTMGSCLTGRETRSIAVITFNSRWVSSPHCVLHTRASRPLTCCKTSPAIMLMLTRTSETHNRTIDASKTPVQDGPLLSIYLHNSTCMAGQVSVESVAIQRQQIHLPYYWSCCWTSIAINMCKKCKKEGCTTKETQHTLAIFERPSSTKFYVSVGDNEHHDGGYEVALSS